MIDRKELILKDPFEVHITATPCSKQVCAEVSARHNCWVSEYTHDEYAPSHGKQWWTFRAQTYEEAAMRMELLCKEIPVSIIRKKIEHIVYDESITS